MPAPVCGACQRPITVCPECHGYLCTPGCKDRLEDGCVCESASAVVESDGDEDE